MSIAPAAELGSVLMLRCWRKVHGAETVLKLDASRMMKKILGEGD